MPQRSENTAGIEHSYGNCSQEVENLLHLLEMLICLISNSITIAILWLSHKEFSCNKKLQELQEACVQSLGQEDPLEEEMATHSSILA